LLEPRVSPLTGDNTIFDTPVLFLVFNRPEATARVFEGIRKAKPRSLYVASDGARDNRAEESILVNEVRRIATEVDWPCDVKTLFREKNLGSKDAVGEAITWFFQHEEQGIILEDDCLPSQSFFPFCQQMLEMYRDEERVFLISGYNAQQRWKPNEEDYFFSNFGGTWGWASWRRAWEYYDSEMSRLDELVRTNFFTQLLGEKLGQLRGRQLVSAKKSIDGGEISAWDYPWAYSRHLQGGLACVPSVSMISNIGFGPEATHTKVPPPNMIEALNLQLPAKANPHLVADVKYDLKWLGRRNFCSRVFNRLRRMWRRR